jgi:hypothetical protein
MSKLRSTRLRDTRSNRRNRSVPELQCGDHRSEDLYVASATASAIKDKIPGKKTLRDHCDFDRRLCGADYDHETKKMDRRSHRRAELDDSSVRRVPWGPVFRGHFRSQGKEIGVKGERAMKIGPSGFYMPVSNGCTAVRREAVFKKFPNLWKALGPPSGAPLQGWASRLRASEGART